VSGKTLRPKQPKGNADIYTPGRFATPRSQKMGGSDVFSCYGSAEVYPDRRWLKATPASSVSLCAKLSANPLAFGGLGFADLRKLASESLRTTRPLPRLRSEPDL
jgi:hypothetical protein